MILHLALQEELRKSIQEVGVTENEDSKGQDEHHREDGVSSELQQTTYEVRDTQPGNSNKQRRDGASGSRHALLVTTTTSKILKQLNLLFLLRIPN